MSEQIEITSTGTLHEIRDPQGVSYRFVSDGEKQLTSAVIFQEGLLLDALAKRYKNAKITVIIERDKANKDFEQ